MSVAKDQIPPPNPHYKPPASEERFTVDEGPIVLSWPSELGAESVLEFESWIQLVLKRARRRAGIATE